MTTDQLTDPAATTTTAIRWGVATTTPNGSRQFDTRDSLLCAIHDTEAINRPYPGTAAVVYREEEYGPWTDDPAGDEFGTEYRWRDGRREVEPARSRAQADAHTRMRNTRGEGATARTVSRRVKLGPWLPFTPPAPEVPGYLLADEDPQPEPEPELVEWPAAPRRSWLWWINGPWFWLAILLTLGAFVAAAAGYQGAKVGLVSPTVVALVVHFWMKVDDANPS